MSDCLHKLCKFHQSHSQNQDQDLVKIRHVSLREYLYLMEDFEKGRQSSRDAQSLSSLMIETQEPEKNMITDEEEEIKYDEDLLECRKSGTCPVCREEKTNVKEFHYLSREETNLLPLFFAD